jgi:hypothetical protein
MVLAREVRELPGPDPRWTYEPKFAGWRAVVFAAAGVVQSRRNNNLASRFPEIAEATRALGDVGGGARRRRTAAVESVLLARPDAAGALAPIGLPLPLSPPLRDEVAPLVPRPTSPAA